MKRVSVLGLMQLNKYVYIYNSQDKYYAEITAS